MSPELLLNPAAVSVAARAETMLNALTIDVEDYFHVSGFERCVSRSRWDDFLRRASATTPIAC